MHICIQYQHYFWDRSLFQSQLVKEGKDFLLQKGTSKDSQGFRPYKPFCGPHKKRGSYRKRPMGATPHKAVTSRFPQAGGNRTSEAPGVVFDPTTGDEGVEAPLPNDSLKASLSPPVGGRLRSFRRDWQTNKCSSNVLNIITNGYVLPFLSKPNLVRLPLILSEYKARQKDQALATYIQSLLSKNAIERVENVKSLGFYSRLFLVPKPHQRWRPVIDLSRLNTFLHIEKFKMETPESIRTSLIPGEWVSSIDLSDAYLHIPIHPNSRKYLRFCYRSQVFQFTSLPFGLATAPQVFTMIAKEVKLMALSRGLRLHQYLDDWLIRSQSQEEARVNTQAVVDLTQSLGWIINLEKSELKPTQVFSFVGYEYHLDSALVVVAYINKQGGTHSAEMCALLWKIMTWCNDYHITLKARHIPGCLNVMADLLSRSNQVQSTEWSMHPQVFKQICQKWFTPHVELFATHLNHKLPLYGSPVPDPKA